MMRSVIHCLQVQQHVNSSCTFFQRYGLQCTSGMSSKPSVHCLRRNFYFRFLSQSL
uniref:U-box domain-containing protein 9-like isoform X2 n=1 Tax=Rhizophora mucronata TaxID=61149 RepID=A0A2P2IYF8_RHIMU